MKIKFNSKIAVLLVALGMVLGACEDFFNPEPESVALEDNLFDEWYEYRAASMGMYALMQDLVEQIVVLGEVRGDLLEPTDNADRDLIQVSNFNVISSNQYASPVNFYKLIANCNNLMYQIKKKKPSVVDFSQEDDINNYDWLYGEVACMRAWAYFNAVRIFKEIPYIYPDLRSVEQIRNYVNNGGIVLPKDSLDISYLGNSDSYLNDGYHYANVDTVITDDTIVTVTLPKMYVDMSAVIDTFTYELENRVKRIGVNYALDNSDVTWEVTTWNRYAYHTLLAQMYLFDGNLDMAESHLYSIMYAQSLEDNVRYGLDDYYANSSWDNMFKEINRLEHILVLDFDKSSQQQNGLQNLFDNTGGNKYMLKPTKISVENFQTEWRGYDIANSNNKNGQISQRNGVFNVGTPGDIFRGHGVSYEFDGLDLNGGISALLELKRLGKTKEVITLLEGVDTLVTKYSLGKNAYDRDVDYIIYRAGEVHLWYSEILNRSVLPSNTEVHQTTKALQVLNKGDYGNNDNSCEGVRGRVGFDPISAGQYVFTHNPYTNMITGYRYFPPSEGYYPNNYKGKIELIEDYILEEKTRECAYEGERFYDLMRIAQRRDDPSYLAKKVSAKFDSKSSQVIYLKLLNENNWYLDYEEYPE